jgi:hypothetical protein
MPDRDTGQTGVELIGAEKHLTMIVAAVEHHTILPFSP